MKYIKLGIMFAVDCWRLVMDNRYNPLRFIPEPSLQSYFTWGLGTMWSVYFGFVASFYMGWMGYSTITSLIVHFGVLIPMFFTNAVFLDAERVNAPWMLEWRKLQKNYRNK